MYIDILRRLRVAVRRKRQGKMENQQPISPSRQCSSTPAGFGQVFLNKNNVTTLELLPYSSNRASADLSVPSTEINIEGTELW